MCIFFYYISDHFGLRSRSSTPPWPRDGDPAGSPPLVQYPGGLRGIDAPPLARARFRLNLQYTHGHRSCSGETMFVQTGVIASGYFPPKNYEIKSFSGANIVFV